MEQFSSDQNKQNAIGDSPRRGYDAVLGAGTPASTIEEVREQELAKRRRLQDVLSASTLGIVASETPKSYDELGIHPEGTFDVTLKPGDIGYSSATDPSPATYHIPTSGGPGSAGHR